MRLFEEPLEPVLVVSNRWASRLLKPVACDNNGLDKMLDSR